MTYLIQGFALGLAYVAPIGMQNLYVINSAIRMPRIKALQVAFTTIFFDISLAVACFLGVGLLLEKIPVLHSAILMFGSLAVTYIGLRLILTKHPINNEVNLSESTIRIVAVCFAVTWFDPQAIIDGSLLLGGFKASLSPSASKVFITGVVLASFTWFTSLSLLTSIFRKRINIRMLRLINLICGTVIIFFGLKLAWQFYEFMKL